MHWRLLPAVIFSVVVGSAIGLVLGIGPLVNKGAAAMQKPVAQIFKNQNTLMPEDEYMASLVTIIVLFCASATGIYGSLDAGMSGEHTILISKSILDFFTAMVFACNLGLVVSFISIPQCLIFLVIFAFAKVILPLTTPDMIPAMVLVMPVSWFWVNCIVPYL